MTTLDKTIIKVSAVVATSLYLILMIHDFELAIKGLSSVLAFIYILFVGCHIVLCFPTVMIGVLVSVGVDYIFKKEKSVIIYWLLFLFIFIPTCLFVYIVIPTLITMGCTDEYNFAKANEILCNI